MKRLLLASICLVAVGCAGDGTDQTSVPFAGNFTGTWVNVNDATDTGTSNWSIAPGGAVTGTDHDSTPADYAIAGTVDFQGHLVSTSTSSNPTNVVEMDGTMNFDGQGRLIVNVVWQGNPPATYRYTLTRH